MTSLTETFATTFATTKKISYENSSVASSANLGTSKVVEEAFDAEKVDKLYYTNDLYWKQCADDVKRFLAPSFSQRIIQYIQSILYFLRGQQEIKDKPKNQIQWKSILLYPSGSDGVFLDYQESIEKAFQNSQVSCPYKKIYFNIYKSGAPALFFRSDGTFPLTPEEKENVNSKEVLYITFRSHHIEGPESVADNVRRGGMEQMCPKTHLFILTYNEFILMYCKGILPKRLEDFLNRVSPHIHLVSHNDKMLRWLFWFVIVVAVITALIFFLPKIALYLFQ